MKSGSEEERRKTNNMAGCVREGCPPNADRKEVVADGTAWSFDTLVALCRSRI